MVHDLPGLHQRYRQTREPAALAALVEIYWPFARSLAARFRRGDDDVVQVAGLGLLKALRGFDPARGFKFTTYAAHCIHGELRHYVRDGGISMIRLTRPAWEAGRKLQIVSLDEILPGDDDGVPRVRADIMGREDAGFTAAEARADLLPVLRRLAPHVRLTLFLYFWCGRTQDEVAARVGIRQESVSRICRRWTRMVASQRFASRRAPRGFKDG